MYSCMMNKSLVRFFPNSQFYLHILYFGCEVLSFCCNDGDFMKRRDDFCVQIQWLAEQNHKILLYFFFFAQENSMILLHLRCSYFTMEVYKFYANTLILFDNLKCSCWKGIMYSVISLRLREMKTRYPSGIWMSVNFSYPIIVSLFFYIIWTVLMPAITSANCQFLILLLFK